MNSRPFVSFHCCVNVTCLNWKQLIKKNTKIKLIHWFIHTWWWWWWCCLVWKSICNNIINNRVLLCIVFRVCLFVIFIILLPSTSIQLFDILFNFNVFHFSNENCNECEIKWSSNGLLSIWSDPKWWRKMLLLLLFLSLFFGELPHFIINLIIIILKAKNSTINSNICLLFAKRQRQSETKWEKAKTCNPAIICLFHSQWP